MSLFKNSGFEPLFYQPDWRNPHPRAWASGMAALAIFAAHRSEQGVVLGGFSGGALTALLTVDELQETSAIPVDGLVGCSLSPWFGGDYVRRAHLFSTDLRDASEGLKNAFSELQLPKIGCPAQLYVGQQEFPTLHEIREDAVALWPNVETITPPCGHDIFHTSYLQALSQNVGRLAVQRTDLSFPVDAAA